MAEPRTRIEVGEAILEGRRIPCICPIQGVPFALKVLEASDQGALPRRHLECDCGRRWVRYG